MLRDKLRRFFSATCAICRESDPTGLNLCQICVANLQVAERCCHLCALPLMTECTSSPDDEASLPICGECMGSLPPPRRTISALSYSHPASMLIHQFKFGGHLYLAHTFASLLAARLSAADAVDIDCVIPIPLSRHRLLERGFNQAEEIARLVAAERELPLKNRILERHGKQQPQMELNRSKRKRNVSGVFSVSGDLAGLRCVLVDDVMTTGATVWEAAAALKSAGALSVDVWVLARTP